MKIREQQLNAKIQKNELRKKRAEERKELTRANSYRRVAIKESIKSSRTNLLISNQYMRQLKALESMVTL